jgi:hypothetical protein
MKCRVCNKEKLKVIYNEEKMSDRDLKWFKEGEEVGRALIIKEFKKFLDKIPIDKNYMYIWAKGTILEAFEKFEKELGGKK